jgi:hypothetical protein
MMLSIKLQKTPAVVGRCSSTGAVRFAGKRLEES